MQNILNSYRQYIYYPVMVLMCGVIALSIVNDDGGQPPALLLLVLLIPLAFQNGFFREQQRKRWIFALLCPVVVSIPLFIGSQTGEALDAPARYFAAAVCLTALSGYVIKIEWVMRSASVGLILTLLLKFALLSQDRVDWGIGVLESGYLGAVLLSMSISHFFIDKGKLFWRIVAVAGIVCGFIVVVKTGSRGTWPAIAFICFLHFMMLPLSLAKKIVLSLLGVSILVLSAFYVPSINNRVNLSIEEARGYIYENNHATSLGYRLDFWQIAIRSFVESPIWGVSYDRRSEIMDEFMAEHPASIHIGNDGRSSSHNEVLNALSKKGLLGLASILLLYIIPLQFFIRQLKRGKGWKANRVATAGIGVVATMIICGLSEAPLMNVRVATTYSFVLIFLFHALHNLDKPASPAKNNTSLPSGS